MPRTNICSDPNKKKDLLFLALIDFHKKQEELSTNDIASKIQMPHRTLNDKLKNLDRLTLKEAQRLCKVLKFTDEEKAKVL